MARVEPELPQCLPVKSVAALRSHGVGGMLAGGDESPPGNRVRENNLTVDERIGPPNDDE